MAIADGFHVDSNGNLWLGSDRKTFDSQTRSEAPFYVYANGNLVANSGTFSGDLSAAGGTFDGDISGASGTFTGDLSGANISGGTIDIGGSDSTSFHVDTDGNMWLGASTYASAPFKVSNQGSVTASSGSFSGNISGGTINISGFHVDSNGNMWLGNANYSSAPFKVSAAGALEAASISADKITSGKFNTQRIPDLDASIITAGTLSLGSAQFDGNGFVAVGTISITPSQASTIGNLAYTTMNAGTATFGGITATNSGSFNGNIFANGTVRSDSYHSASKYYHITSNTNIDMNSSFVYIKPNNANGLTVGSGSNVSTFYTTVWPDGYNNRDLGSSTRRWRDIYTVGAVDTSDINFKTDIEPLALGLDFINTLDTIQFKWAETDDSPAGIRTHTGFSAQDIEQKLIDYGVQEKDYALFTNSQITEDPEGPALYGLRTGELISILTKAVQELSAKNDELESRLAALEG